MLLKIESTIINLDRVRKFNLKDNGDVVVVYSHQEAYRLRDERAAKLRRWLTRNSEEVG